MNFFLERRNELKLTQRDIAMMLGITDKAVSAWERGDSIPRRTIEAAVAVAYSVPLKRLQEEIRKITQPDPSAAAS